MSTFFFSLAEGTSKFNESKWLHVAGRIGIRPPRASGLGSDLRRSRVLLTARMSSLWVPALWSGSGRVSEKPGRCFYSRNVRTTGKEGRKDRKSLLKSTLSRRGPGGWRLASRMAHAPSDSLTAGGALLAVSTRRRHWRRPLPGLQIDLVSPMCLLCAMGTFW